MIDLEATFVVGADLVIISGADLDEHERLQIGCYDDDYVLSRRLSRSNSKIIDRRSFDLLMLFQTPRTLIGAIITQSTMLDQAPEVVLEEYFPILQAFVNGSFIVPSVIRDSGTRTPSLIEGGCFAGYRIGECLQLYEDTEVYLVRGSKGREAVMKISRIGASRVAAELAREACLQRQLDEMTTPALLSSGTADGRAYLVTAWSPGRPCMEVADRLRSEPNPRPAILRLCINILRAFAHLHDQGVVHGDVHARNVLVSGDGKVSIIDYGLARSFDGRLGSCDEPDRGGVGFFFDPQLAQARLAHERPPPADIASEQYSLGCLVYLLLTGSYYLDFSFDERSLLRQICSEDARSFTAVGVAPWTEVEQAVGTAHSKDPSERWQTVSAFADRLEVLFASLDSAPLPSCSAARSSGTNSAASRGLIISDVMSEVGPSSLTIREGAEEATACSVHSGASGVAYGLLRIATRRSDPLILAAADIWSTRAMHHAARENAYFEPELGVTEATVGSSSIAFSAIGTAYVHALVSEAYGNLDETQRGIDLLIDLCSMPCSRTDVFSGQAGHLIACANLLEIATRPHADLDMQGLRQFGETIAHKLGQPGTDLSGSGGAKAAHMSFAHGFPGVLYALMRWSEAMGRVPPYDVESRLGELAASSSDKANGMTCPTAAASSDISAIGPLSQSWCNGRAGQIHTWLLAHRLFPDGAFVDLAIQSGRRMVEYREAGSVPFLCCGDVGIAYAALALAEATGDAFWKKEAHRLADRATLNIRSPWLPTSSLFRGALGLAVLITDLEGDGDYPMPIVGRHI